MPSALDASTLPQHASATVTVAVGKIRGDVELLAAVALPDLRPDRPNQ